VAAAADVQYCTVDLKRILRRVLKAEELGEAPGDLSMLDDTE